MPQGRRKVPFSAKQKKAQLQNKREQKKVTRPAHQTIHRKPLVSDDGDIEDELDTDETTLEGTLGQLEFGQSSTIVDQAADSGTFLSKIHSINVQRNLAQTRGVNRYALQFFTESDQEIRERKERAQKPFKLLDEKDGLVCSVEDLFGESNDSHGIPGK